MENNCEVIRNIIISMIDNDEIEIKKWDVINIDEKEELTISSLDKIKIVVELENYFMISIDDKLLGKLDSIWDFYHIVSCTLSVKKEKEGGD